MLKEREGHLEVVVEIDGHNQPILAQVDIDSIFTLRNSLAHALCLPKPVEGPLMVWDKESRLPYSQESFIPDITIYLFQFPHFHQDFPDNLVKIVFVFYQL